MDISAGVSSSSYYVNEQYDEESFSSDNCDFCGAVLDPSRLVFDFKTVTVSCSQCGQVNSIYGKVEEEQISAPSITEQPIPRELQISLEEGTPVKETESLSESPQKTTLPLPPPEFRCTQCSKTFKLQIMLKKHMQVTHALTLTMDSNVTKFKELLCTMCNRPFKSQRALSIHITLRHGETVKQKKFKCDLCNYSSDKKSAAEAHKIVHTRETSFCCDHCGKKFGLKDNLAKHMRVHTEKPGYAIPCTNCWKSYTNPDSLRRHQRKCHAINDANSYQEQGLEL